MRPVSSGQGSISMACWPLHEPPKGDCWDNAVMERFFGSLKSEWTNNQRYSTREQAPRDVIEYIALHYNSDRLRSSLGYIARGSGNWPLLRKWVSVVS